MKPLCVERIIGKKSEFSNFLIQNNPYWIWNEKNEYLRKTKRTISRIYSSPNNTHDFRLWDTQARPASEP